ncbi:hypothetical protein QUA07_27935 [Microcoleus sp. T3_A4]|uniref:hypothetical protein n=1 Tax=Microcoleus sp. T3_A4 TaxID=2818968 RepID=UPI002FD51BFA
MLTQQFFTRVQLAKILNFKSNGMLQNLEKKGFITPQIKPSKYTFNQILFMMICKEITEVTNLSWKYFIDVDFNRLLQVNLVDYNVLLISGFKNTNYVDLQLKNDDKLVKEVNDFLDSDIYKMILKLKRIDNTDYEKIPSCNIYNDDNCFLLTFSIDRIYRKLHRKCIELKIDLSEKYSFESISDNTASSIIFKSNNTAKKVELTTIY